MMRFVPLLALALAGAPSMAWAQADAPATAFPAPRGHLQPRPMDRPPAAEARGGSSGLTADDPAALQRRLEASDDAAVHSICADCLKRQPDNLQP